MRSKKGFTLVELLIVIAILAILATVSIVGYTSFIDKANESNDMALVNQLNTILKASEMIDGKNTTIVDAIADLTKNDVNLETLKLSVKGRKVVWDEASDRFVIVDSNNSVVYAPDEYKADEAKPTTVPTSYTTLNNSNSSVVTITEDTVIDLGGESVEFTRGSQLVVSGATVVLMDSTGSGEIKTELNGIPLIAVKDGGHLIVNGGKVTAASDFKKGYYQTSHVITVYSNSTLTVNGGEIVNKLPDGAETVDNFSAFAIGLGNSANAKLYINGGHIESTQGYAIAGNGSNTTNSYIEINGGEIISGTDSAIYHPQSGLLSIRGGYIKGASCVYIKSGQLMVSGGEFEAVGEAKAYERDGNGSNPTGDCIVVDSMGYPQGAPFAYVINNAKLSSAHGKTIGVYVVEGNTVPTVTLNGAQVDHVDVE